MNICWWEHDELIDHLASRQDIWTQSEDNPAMWLRSTEDEALCALLLAPPAKTGPFRQYAVRVVPAAWSREECDKYVEALLNHWTSYLRRQQVETFLIDSLDVKPETASLAAIAIQANTESGSVFTDPEVEPIQADLFGATNEPEPGKLPSEVQYDIHPGGYLNLQPRGDSFYVRVSIPTHKKYGGGYSSPLTGYIRPTCGRVNQTLAFLTGIALGPDDLPETAQSTLFEEE
jgi:hypothetical protein